MVSTAIIAAVAVASQLPLPLQDDPYYPPVNIRPDLSIKVRPKVDRVAPYDFTLSGFLQTNGVDESIACNGRVMLRIRKSNPTVAKGRTNIGADCFWSKTLTVRNGKLTKKARKGGTFRISARFGGNEYLQPDAAPQRKASYGRLKP